MTLLPGLPEPQAVTVAQVAAIVVQSREARELCHDIETAKESKRRLDALHKYIADKKARAALEAEQRLWEILIGKLLGPAENHGPATHNPSTVEGLAYADRNRFRALADHEDDVLALVEQGVTKRAQILKRIERRERQNSEAANVTGLVDLRHTDAASLLADLPPASVDLLLTDPPYMTDVQDIDAFVDTWLDAALACVRDTGRIYICCGAYPAELVAYLSRLLAQDQFTVAVPLVWTYRNTLGPAPTRAYKTNWQAILYAYGPNAPALDCPEMIEQFTVQDISAPDGRHGTRVHAWQKPDALAERLIRHSTLPGQTVLDPFAGTGTFAAVAARLGRHAIAAERDPEMLQLCAQRGLMYAA